VNFVRLLMDCCLLSQGCQACEAPDMPFVAAGASKRLLQCVLSNNHCISIDIGVTSWMLDAACAVCTLQCDLAPLPTTVSMKTCYYALAAVQSRVYQ
jgi:hypothetical protein